VIREQFPGRVGEANVQAAREAYEQVQVTGVKFESDNQPAHLQRAAVESLPQYYQFDRYDELPGYRRGSPWVWRDKIPVCEDASCTCVGSCISEIVCPDGTGFIVRKDMPHQGYRIDLDYCRGCGLCAQVCVGSALTMVDEDQVKKINPQYQQITVEPHLKEVAARPRFRPVAGSTPESNQE
jgi:Pyruvate/2-oxoacid:ferredoxin oxidoreductase delta subunit